MSTQTAPVKNAVEQFVEFFLAGLEAWINAGKLVSRELEKDPLFAKKVHAQYPSISEDVVYGFDRVGRGVWHPKLLMSDVPGVRRLRKMAYSVQEKYIDSPVSVLTKKHDGWKMLPMSVFVLTHEQAMQAFGDEDARTEAEQLAFLNEKQTKKSMASQAQYKIIGDRLVVFKPVEFTPKKLSQILAKISAKR